MMERKSGFDDLSPDGFKVAKSLDAWKECLCLLETQEKPHLHIEMLSGQAS
jgi:hypothetical protein